MNQQRTLNIKSEIDVITARMQVREMARSLGMNLGDQARISLASSSLAHALGLGGACPGRLVMGSIQNGARTGLQVVCSRKDGDSVPETTVFYDTRWMVDELVVDKHTNEDLQVTIIKWLG